MDSSEKSSVRKMLLFDFDGTIADSFLMVIEEYNRFAPWFFARPIPEDSFEEIRSLSIQDLAVRQHVNLVSGFFLFGIIQLQMYRRVKELHPYKNILLIIQLIHVAYPDLIIGILSSNNTLVIDEFLDANHAKHSFSEVLSSNGVFNKNKIVGQLIKKYALIPANILYVTDEKRDVIMAKKCEIKSLGVTWGYGSKSSLMEYSPDYLVESPDSMIEIIEAFV